MTSPQQPDKRTIYTAADDAKLTFAAAVEGADHIGTLVGYPLVWNVISSDRGGYRVRLLPGSAEFVPTTHALYHHEWAGGPLGDTATNTLRIIPDEYGVRVEIDLPNTTAGRDVLELVRTRRMRGMSFAMIGAPEGTVTEEGGLTIFNASSYTVDEVTVTAIPAFSETSIDVKPEAVEPPAENSFTSTQERTAQRLKLERLKINAPQPWAEYPRKAD